MIGGEKECNWDMTTNQIVRLIEWRVEESMVSVFDCIGSDREQDEEASQWADGGCVVEN